MRSSREMRALARSAARATERAGHFTLSQTHDERTQRLLVGFEWALSRLTGRLYAAYTTSAQTITTRNPNASMPLRGSCVV